MHENLLLGSKSMWNKSTQSSELLLTWFQLLLTLSESVSTNARTKARPSPPPPFVSQDLAGVSNRFYISNISFLQHIY